MSKFFKVGIALGGGGARGIAHLGVLSVLKREGIPIDLIVGTSFGALVGGLYAIDPDAEKIQDHIRHFVKGPRFKKTTINFLRESLQSKQQESGLLYSLKSYVKHGIFMSRSITKGAFITEDDFLEVIGGLVKDYRFEDTVIPFSCIATDMLKGCEAVLNEGEMLRPISASCSIPGIFPVISCNGSKMVDGGWVNKIPVEPAIEQGADFVIGVDTSDNFDQTETFNTGLQVLTRANDITRKALSDFQSCFADFIIRPEIGHIHWTGFSKADECFEKGAEAAEAIVGQLKKEIFKKKFSSFVFLKKKRYQTAKDRFIFTRK